MSTKHRRFELTFPVRMALWRWQQMRCYLCGAELASPEKNTANGKAITATDHIYPGSRGGANWLGNAGLACQPCDNRKGQRLPRPCEFMFGVLAAEGVMLALGRAQYWVEARIYALSGLLPARNTRTRDAKRRLQKLENTALRLQGVLRR